MEHAALRHLVCLQNNTAPGSYATSSWQANDEHGPAVPRPFADPARSDSLKTQREPGEVLGVCLKSAVVAKASTGSFSPSGRALMRMRPVITRCNLLGLAYRGSLTPELNVRMNTHGIRELPFFLGHWFRRLWAGIASRRAARC